MDIVTRQQLNMLINLALADKQFVPKEKRLIFKIAKDKGYARRHVTELIEHTEPVGSFGALTPEQKFEYLYNAISLVKVDNKVPEREMMFCQDIAIRLGYNKHVVNILLDIIDGDYNEAENLEDLKKMVEDYLPV
jgi:hypothetical protein